MTYLDEHFEETSALAVSVARSVRKRYPTADQDDLFQVGLMWCIEHPRKFREYVEEKATGKLFRALHNHMSHYARTERAKYYGYSLEDEVFYSKRMLKGDGKQPGLLEYVFDRESWYHPPAPDGGGGKRSGDPAEGNGWLATMIDVSQACDRLAPEDRNLLREHYMFGDTYEQIGTRLGVSKAAVAKYIDRAVARLQDHLGGSRPREDPAEDGWEQEPAYVGTRRAISNAHARAVLEAQWAKG